MGPFNKFMLSMNPTSGDSRWWIIWTIGWSMTFGWAIFALPMISSIIGGPEWIASMDSDSFTAYSTWTLNSEEFELYFLVGVFLVGVPVAKVGWLLGEIGGGFARGYIWTPPAHGGILSNHWSRP
jgi:hypothetical protein